MCFVPNLTVGWWNLETVSPQVLRSDLSATSPVPRAESPGKQWSSVNGNAEPKRGLESLGSWSRDFPLVTGRGSVVL